MDDNILKAILSMKFKSLIKTHSLVILLMEFKSIIKIHDLNPRQFYQWNSNTIIKAHGSSSWQIIYQKPNSH